MSWMAFAEGFARTAAGIIQERKDEAEEYQEKMREMAERNKGKLTLMEQAVKENEAFVLRAKSLGASDAQVSMALDSGVNGLRDMVTNLTNLKNQMGEYYTPEQVQLAYAVPEDYTSTNIDVRTRFGLSGATVGDTETPDGGFLDKAFGRDAMSRARAEIDQELVAGTDMSVFDLAGLTDAQLYESLNPASILAYNAPRFMDDEEAVRQESLYARTYQNVLNSASAQYDAALSNWAASNPMLGPESAEYQAEAGRLAGIRDSQITNALTNFVASKQDVVATHAVWSRSLLLWQ